MGKPSDEDPGGLLAKRTSGVLLEVESHATTARRTTTTTRARDAGMRRAHPRSLPATALRCWVGKLRSRPCREVTVDQAARTLPTTRQTLKMTSTRKAQRIVWRKPSSSAQALELQATASASLAGRPPTWTAWALRRRGRDGTMSSHAHATSSTLSGPRPPMHAKMPQRNRRCGFGGGD